MAKNSVENLDELYRSLMEERSNQTKVRLNIDDPRFQNIGTFAHSETMANALWKLFLSKPYDWMKISQKMKLNILISNL